MKANKIEKFTHLGYVLNIISQHASQCYRTAVDIRELAENAIAHEQIQFFFQQNFPVGYIAWAYLSEEVIGKMLFYRHKLHYSEWDEGDYLWIMDSCFIDDIHINLWIEFLCSTFHRQDHIYWSDSTFNSKQIYRLSIKTKKVAHTNASAFMNIIGKNN